MIENSPLARSPELMSPADTGLLVIDVQEKLMPLIPDQKRIVWNIRRLIDGAKTLGVQVFASEQYPQGLGATVSELRDRLERVSTKVAFSCGACVDIFAELEQRGMPKLLLAGIEAHVCVQQTAFDLMAAGYQVYLAVDAIGARSAIDYQFALRRMESAGATVTTTEAVLFEWCGVAGTPQFKQISALVKEQPPAE